MRAWTVLRAAFPEREGWKRTVDAVRARMARPQGPVVVEIPEELMPVVLALLEAEVELALALEAANKGRAVRRLALAELWTRLRDEADLDPNAALTLDIVDMCVRTTVPTPSAETRVEASRRWTLAIAGLLEDPLLAHRASRDTGVPSWFRRLGHALSRTDGGPELALSPVLRGLIESWIEDPRQAQCYVDAGLDGPPFLAHAATVLGLQAPWPVQETSCN